MSSGSNVTKKSMGVCRFTVNERFAVDSVSFEKWLDSQGTWSQFPHLFVVGVGEGA